MYSVPFLNNLKRAKVGGRKVLSEEELKNCQAAISSIKADMEKRNQNPDEELNRYLKQNNFFSLTSLDHKQFFNMIKGLYLSKESRNMLNLDDSSKKGLSNLIHYLAREEKGKVSIAKLKEAFKLSSRATPLQQEQIAEEKQVMRKMTSMWKTGAVPGAVRHLLHWMQENHHEFRTLFQGYEGTIPIKSFELLLN